jgi:hypothetical protein
MPRSPHAALSAAVSKLLRPLVRILLQHGVSFGSFNEVAKRVFVEVASEDFALEGRKQSVSRVALLTGLTRKEVARLRDEPPLSDQETEERHNRAARVIGGWLRDRAFSSHAGRPRELPLEGEQSFSTLVRRYSGDVPPRAVLDELLRVEAVSQTGDGRVHLLTPGYVPRGSEVDKLHMLGTDVAALIATIDNNLAPGDSPALFQRKVLYDNLPDEALPALRELADDKGQALLVALNQWMSQHDRDLAPDTPGTGRNRAGLGIYYFEAPVEPEDDER